MNVLHSCNTWLSPSENWVHVQIANLPDTFRCEVVARSVDQPEKFVVRKLHSVPTTIARPDSSKYVTSSPVLNGMLSWAGRSRERLALGRLLETRSIDLIHSHFGPVGWRDAAPAALLALPHVVTFYGFDVTKLPRIRPKWKARYRDLFRAVSLVLCEGEHMASEIVNLGCPQRKVRVHRLGIEVEKFRFSARLRSVNEPFRVLMAARFREKKGFVYGIEALGRLKSEFNFELTIIGDGPEDERTKISDAIAKAGLSARTRVVGFLAHTEMLEQAYRHHVYLAPSVTGSDGDTEGGAPVSIIEMMGTGMPVVASRHCDIPNVVIDGTTGFLAPERDVAALSASLRALFLAEERWPTMGELARERVEAEFNSKTQGRRLGDLYAQVSPGPATSLSRRAALAARLAR
jgi:colanic acid/amylovoran biosynthesis glycosyltransferase